MHLSEAKAEPLGLEEQGRSRSWILFVLLTVSLLLAAVILIGVVFYCELLSAFVMEGFLYATCR